MGIFNKPRNGSPTHAASNVVPNAVWESEQQIREGHALEDCGQIDAALAKYQEALRLNPANHNAYLNIGNVQFSQGKESEAVASYRNALQLKPDYAAAHVNLGRLYFSQQHHDAAAASYSAAIRTDPTFVDAYLGLGLALEALERVDEAVAAYREALVVQSDFAGAHLNLGHLLMQLSKTDMAASHLEQAIQGFPNHAHAHWWLGKLYKDMGLLAQAIAHLRRACELEPSIPDFRGLLLFTLLHDPNVSPAMLLEEHNEYDRQFAAVWRSSTSYYPNAADPERRLRLGYISGDFRDHPVARFIEPVLTHYDRNQFEVHAFHNHYNEDSVTERLKQRVDHWHAIASLNDDRVIAHIRELGIDLLVDLSGHTENHRLQVFARHPAPVQFTWLGYLGTTGLSAMDYRICDIHTDPPGLTEAHHTERLARLPASQWCHMAYDNLPPVAPLPLMRHGYPTLGSFNNVSKLNDRVIALWVEVLRALPQARLRIAAAPAGRAQERLLSLLTGQGVESTRIEFVPRTGYRDYLAALSDVDIALDPFPYNGGTTTLDALIMGVPVVSLVGERSVARGGASLLINAGLGECVAQAPGDYVTIVRQLLTSPARLATIRARLRGDVEKSILQNGPRFTRQLEVLYRERWREWCKKQKTH